MSKSKSASKISLKSFDDLFQPTVEEMHTHELSQNQIVEIPVSCLIEFENHPYLVVDDDKMHELTESIKEQGILSPLVVRKKSEDQYEIISGHRRKRGAELAELTTVPVIIRDLSDDEAVISMVNANLQREHLLPSEKAKAYKMKYDAMKHQGKNGGRSLKKMEEESGESQMTIHRFLRLNDLIQELLDMIDAGKLGLSQGVDLSFLSEEAQRWVLEVTREKKIRISLKQSARLKECAQKQELSAVMVNLILEDKRKNRNKAPLSIRREKVREYFEADATDEFMEETILRLLGEWKAGEDAR